MVAGIPALERNAKRALPGGCRRGSDLDAKLDELTRHVESLLQAKAS